MKKPLKRFHWNLFIILYKGYKAYSILLIRMKKESLKELQERYELVLELKYMLEQNMNRNWGYDLTEEKKRLIRLNKEIEDIKDLASKLIE